MFRKIGLGGGGAKGILHVGALRELSKHQKLYFPDGVYGCSVGSIIATLVAFEIPLDDKLIKLTQDFCCIDRFVPPISIDVIENAIPQKGAFDMTTFVNQVAQMFELSGLDIRNLKLGDAKMPLFIIASNISKGVATYFTGNVPILDAIRCSCCLPVVFRPQELYGNLYIDGDAFLPYIGSVEKDAFVISLKTHLTPRITPETLESVALPLYIREVYNMGIMNVINMHKTDLTVELLYPKLMADSDLSKFDVPDIIAHAEKLTRNFLTSKGFLKEVAEV